MIQTGLAVGCSWLSFPPSQVGVVFVVVVGCRLWVVVGCCLLAAAMAGVVVVVVVHASYHDPGGLMATTLSAVALRNSCAYVPTPVSNCVSCLEP